VTLLNSGKDIVICLLIIQAFLTLWSKILRFIEIKPAVIVEDTVDGQNQNHQFVIINYLQKVFHPRSVQDFVKRIIWSKQQYHISPTCKTAPEDAIHLSLQSGVDYPNHKLTDST